MKILTDEGATGVGSVQDLVAGLTAPRAVWVMVPAGAITDSVIDELAQTLEPGDTVIDGGNSYYRDDMRHAERLAKGGIRLLDCGTSGGVWGLGAWLQPDDRRRGRGLRAVVDHLDEVPGPAIEYGMMGSIAEGLNILHKASIGTVIQGSDAEAALLADPEYYRYDIDLPEVAQVWRRGSVIGSWLIDLSAAALRQSSDLADYAGRVSDSGEGRWTPIAAKGERAGSDADGRAGPPLCLPSSGYVRGSGAVRAAQAVRRTRRAARRLTSLWPSSALTERTLDMAGPMLVLFDIDETLVHTGGAGARSWAWAFDQLHGVPADIGAHTSAGETDPQVGRKTFQAVLGRDPSFDEMARLYAKYLWHLAEDIWTSPDYRVLDGAEDLLQRLGDAGVMIGVISGAMEGAARTKMEPGKLNRYFTFGAYGSDSPDRTELTEMGIAKAARLLGHEVARDQVYVVGDTPRDIEAAHAAGATAIGVASGHYHLDALRDAKAEHVLRALTEPFPGL